MSVNVECISNALMSTTNTADKICKRFIFTPTPKFVFITITITLMVSLSVVLSGENFEIIKNVYAQTPQLDDNPTSQDKITIQLNSAKFAPLTDGNSNQ